MKRGSGGLIKGGLLALAAIGAVVAKNADSLFRGARRATPVAEDVGRNLGRHVDDIPSGLADDVAGRQAAGIVDGGDSGIGAGDIVGGVAEGALNGVGGDDDE